MYVRIQLSCMLRAYAHVCVCAVSDAAAYGAAPCMPALARAAPESCPRWERARCPSHRPEQLPAAHGNSASLPGTPHSLLPCYAASPAAPLAPCAADLNGFLLQMEENIADFAAELGCTALEQQYRQLAASRWAWCLLPGMYSTRSSSASLDAALQSCPRLTLEEQQAPRSIPSAAMESFPAGGSRSTRCSGAIRRPR